jgi:retron-type reverse transcriptase
MDITKFFDCVDQEKLKECLRRRVYDAQVLWLCDKIIDSYVDVSGRSRGIPIGNLTSQIFANIYLNEFDRYVRHILRPLAYVRYGDDCVFFARTERQARQLRTLASGFLRDELKLTINPRNDVIVPAAVGLKFLGHIVTLDGATVDSHTSRRALERVNYRNLSSYKALNLDKWQKRRLEQQVLDEVEKTICPKT